MLEAWQFELSSAQDRHVVAVGKQALQRSTAARKASAFALTKDASIRIPHNRAAHTPADYGAAIRDIFL